MNRQEFEEKARRFEPDEEGFICTSFHKVARISGDTEIRTEEYKRDTDGVSTTRRRIFDETHDGEIVMRTEAVTDTFPEPLYMSSLGSNEPLLINPIRRSGRVYTSPTPSIVLDSWKKSKAPKSEPKHKPHPLTDIFKE